LSNARSENERVFILKSDKQFLCRMIGSDGWERLEAIARLMPENHSYRERPFLLAVHLLSMGIDKTEKVVRERLGIIEPTTEEYP